MKIWPIESNSLRLDGGAMFGNAPKEVWEKWATPDVKNRIKLATRCLLVEDSRGRLILFEAGLGAFFEPKLKDRFGIEEQNHVLIDNLNNMGIKHTDIEAVVLSHLHFDHAGGLLSAYDGTPPQLLFTNAKYYVGGKHLKVAINPHMRERASFIPILQKLLIKSGRLVHVDGERHPDLDNVHFRFSNGHTIGMMISVLEADTGPLAFVTDLVPGAPWVHLPINMGYDRFSELKVDEKETLYKELLPKDGTLFFTHDPTTATGKLQINDKGMYFTSY